VEFALVLLPLVFLMLLVLDLAPVLGTAMLVPFAAARGADAAAEGASTAVVDQVVAAALPMLAPASVAVVVNPPVGSLTPQGWVTVTVTAEVPVPVGLGLLPPELRVSGSATEQVW
jgi:Flp pilus assembly protein TadG